MPNKHLLVLIGYIGLGIKDMLTGPSYTVILTYIVYSKYTILQI